MFNMISFQRHQDKKGLVNITYEKTIAILSLLPALTFFYNEKKPVPTAFVFSPWND